MRSAVQIRPAAPRKALSLNGFKAFLLLLFLPVFLIWGERGVNIFRELINDIYGFRFRRGNDVRVNVAGGADLGVPQIAGDHNQGGSLCNQQTGIGVPLRYNKDKRKNPVFSRVSAFVVAYSIPFPTLIANEKSVE